MGSRIDILRYKESLLRQQNMRGGQGSVLVRKGVITA
jgi:hypothetical protein